MEVLDPSLKPIGPKLYIYEKKEKIFIGFLFILSLAFCFTLGIHLGKSLVTGSSEVKLGLDTPATTTTDQVPSRYELAEQYKGIDKTLDQLMAQSLHQEVTKTGVALEKAHPTELPDPVVGSNQEEIQLSLREQTIPAFRRSPPEGRFTLKLGSYPSLESARSQVDALEALGIKPFLRAEDLGDKGRWYKVYLGGYISAEEAENEGSKYQKRHYFDQFQVVEMP